MIIPVVAALIYDKKQKKVLITQRKHDKPFPLSWEFPGGKIEEGEDHSESLKREIQEELAVEISVGSLFHIAEHHEKKFSIKLFCYECTLLGGALQLLGVNDVKWVTLQELSSFDFAPADRSIVEKLLAGSENGGVAQR